MPTQFRRGLYGRAVLIALQLFAAVPVAAGAFVEPTSGGCDYSDAAQNNGWGWNPQTRESCPPRTMNSPNTNPFVPSGVVNCFAYELGHPVSPIMGID